MPRKIYIASSWLNQHHYSVVLACQSIGHQVYDFKNPPNKSGFSWGQLDEDWKTWSPEKYLEMLDHKIAQEGFKADMNGLD